MSVINKYPTGVFDTQMGLQEKNTPPPQMKLSDVKIVQKKTLIWKK
jgi:hypothetical protein